MIQFATGPYGLIPRPASRKRLTRSSWQKGKLMTHLNHLRTVMGAATVVLAFAFAPSAFAQQQGGMPGMDMQMMMNHCAQVRYQVQQSQVPAMVHPAEVQQELARCDQMDLM